MDMVCLVFYDNKGKRLWALVDLALGAVLGMAGTMVGSQNLRAVLWAIDGTGLIVATSLLALAQFRKGNDLIAAGFLVYAIGDMVMLAAMATLARVRACRRSPRGRRPVARQLC